MNEQMHVQCLLKRGNTKQTAWIPEKFAKIGKLVQVKEDKFWSDGWEIHMVGTKKSSKSVQDNSDRLHKGIFGSIKNIFKKEK